MMEMIVIYGSQYGSSKDYALELAKNINCDCKDYKEVKDLNNYNLIIHVGGLFAGGIKGLNTTLKYLPVQAKLIIITVGISDNTSKVNIDNIRKGIKRQVPSNILENTLIFHLRGAIDYQKLSVVHRFLMSLVYKQAIKVDPEKRSEEDKDIIATYNNKVSFVDFAQLKPIIDAINNLI